MFLQGDRMGTYKLEKRDGWVFVDEVLGKEASIPPGWDPEILETPDSPAIASDEDIKKAVIRPCCGKSIPSIVREKGARTAGILVSDATRGIPTAPMLKYVVDELLRAGLSEKDIFVFVGIGVHRAATEDEFREIMGDLYGIISIENHDPYDRDKLIDLGTTTRGTPVIVNKKAYECHMHIQIGKVEPHEFAGFSGGRKSVLPGISSEETIAINHRPEMILEDMAAIGVLEGNPVHSDMLEAAGMFGMDFGVNCVLNNRMEISAVFAGDMTKSHLAAIDHVRGNLGVELERPDVIVTTAGRPLDIDFYQSVKALIALTEVLDETIRVVLYAGCPDGVASEDMLAAFRSGKTIEEAVEFTKANYRIQMDHVLLLSKILTKRVEIFVVCDNVQDNEIEDMFMIPAASLEEAIASAASSTGKEKGRILFYPRPQTGLPVLKRGQIV